MSRVFGVGRGGVRGEMEKHAQHGTDDRISRIDGCGCEEQSMVRSFFAGDGKDGARDHTPGVPGRDGFSVFTPIGHSGVWIQSYAEYGGKGVIGAYHFFVSKFSLPPLFIQPFSFRPFFRLGYNR